MCNLRAEYYISPAVIQWWEERGRMWGPIASGALFGAGWWFWVDAVCISHHKVPFDQYLPGIIATLALIMINCIRRDDMVEYDPFDDATYCRSRLWLFLSYIVSFASIVAAVWVMLAHYARNPDYSAAEKWPGAAGIFQVTFILGSGLMFFVSRTPADTGGYNAF
ncbi:hypothetical protein PLESTB_001505800 [Pleodorina starrii]|uniref:Uncharacterized protein n=1 Tax=Pleodorina starrii TaxID=330485 RepID=A0A9W6F8F0_9CHLO|nr:hypothetical protein PLESTM_000660000 [Pleodorina starrii]GLC59610.1 hypothetical protein PLESTB_001505800 [Pleodorina starrii]GLC67847.1 hypothetical protein PLESTF_000613800 [Pleodorina starrii]